MRKRTVRTAGVVVILGAAGVIMATLSHSAWAAGTFNVKDYGWWLRHVTGISFAGCDVRFEKSDGRPAFIADDASSVSLSAVTFDRGTGSRYDLGFSHVNGYSVTGTTSTTGQTPRISAASSTPS